jgi:phosphatidylserine decarboxylase
MSRRDTACVCDYRLPNPRSATKIEAMKHQGKARGAGLRIIGWSFVGLVAITAIGVLAALVGTFVAFMSGFLFGAWVLFALLCLWFFRDPNPRVPMDAGILLAPAHGTVDAIGDATEPEFLGGPCRRVSMFLSIFDVHVQRAPLAGRIAHLKLSPGQFLSATRADSATRNENLLIGIEAGERPGEKIALRLIAGLIARRIVPWISLGETVARGERISLIQFGSRVDVYLPPTAQVKVKLGEHVRGGETVLATWE